MGHSAIMHLSKLSATFALAFALFGPTAHSAVRFTESEIRTDAEPEEIQFTDLNGDGRADLLAIEKTNLVIAFQAPSGTFLTNQLRYPIAKPSLVWPTKFGTSGPASVLLMTADGVIELLFTNRMPQARDLIKQPTLLPAEVDKPSLRFFCFTDLNQNHPFLVLPMNTGLQIWQLNGENWTNTQTLERGFTTDFIPAPRIPGYSLSLDLDLAIADVNGDGRDDLMFRRDELRDRESYALYLQTATGQFELQPTLSQTNKHALEVWRCWRDLNKDGKPDLVQGTWLNEPWFVPGFRSGKVLVGIYLADTQGQLPRSPSFSFRKNDWAPAVPLIDLDGDGFPDLILGYGLFDSRDGLRRMIMTKQVDFKLKFYFWRPGVGYPKEADCQRDLLVRVDRSMLELGWQRGDFERFVNLSGDFNGDGKRDLVIRDRSDQVSVYFFQSREKGFSAEPSLTFHCADPIQSIQVQDLNGDGISDLILRVQKRDTLKTFISEK